jgi:uncharacterized protein GlcG (DUF336 family)
VRTQLPLGTSGYVEDDQVIGAIAVSGVQSHQDAEVAQAGADALK